MWFSSYLIVFCLKRHKRVHSEQDDFKMFQVFHTITWFFQLAIKQIYTLLFIF
jgi:hypothetical protein